MFGNDPPILQFRGPLGVPIEVGSSLLILAFIFIRPFGDPASLLDNCIYFALILLAIFLHEMGHAWGNIVQGQRVTRVVIYGGGGFCESHQSASRHQQELIVAMGPIVNLALWALSSLAYPYLYQWGFYSLGSYVYWFASINIFLFFLNMIPVQPLDGGKLLFLTLRRWMDRRDATKLAGIIGLIFAVLWIPAMIFCFIQLGFLLLFIPSIPLHWRMSKGRTA